jgi:hypothetical protein
MAGGIQKGTEAGSIESKELDGNVKIVSLAIEQAQSNYYYEAGHRNLTSTRVRESKRDNASLPELVKKGITLGCIPDGGMWFDGNRDAEQRTLKVVFEAKHQGDHGNAIERWSTNHDICRFINPDVLYVTFATGEGAVEGGVLHRYGSNMSTIHGDKVKWIYSPLGFTQEQIFDHMSALLGLTDLTFDQIKPYIGKTSTFSKLFEAKKTTEELMAEQAEKQQAIQADNTFLSFLQDETDPLTLVWRKIDRDDRIDARDEIVGMIQDGFNKSEIVEVLKQYYLN